MRNIFKIIKKNFKLLLRTKTSSLIVILGPMLLIFLVGIAFNNADTYGLNIGVYSDEYSNLTDGFVGQLKGKDFNIQKFDDKELCINAIRSGALHTCIEFPANMSFERNDITNEIIFHVDYSKINLVWMIMDTISETLQSESKEVSKGLTQVLLDKLEFTRAEIFNENPKLLELQTENSDMASKTGSALDNLKAMDLGFDYDGMNITRMDSISGNYQARILTLRDYITSRTSEVLEDINNTMDEFEVNSSNYNVLKGAYDDVEEIQQKVEDDYNLTILESQELVNIVDQVQSKLGVVKSNLESATIKKTLIDTKLNSIKETLSTSALKLKELQETLNKIDASIAELKVTKADKIVNPIETKIMPVSTKTTHLNYLFPSLVVLVIMFISILLSNTLVMMEKHSPAHFRNFLVPVNGIIFTIATYLTNLFLVLIQVVIILAISIYVFGSQILPNILDIGLILIMITTFFTFAGMLVGYLFKSEETSTLAAISIGSIFLLLSDMILPMESMPAYILNIAKFNPFVLSQNLMRKAVLFQPHIKALLTEMGFLAGYTLVAFVMIIVLHYISNKNLLQKLNYYSYKRSLSNSLLTKMPVAAKALAVVEKPKKGKNKAEPEEEKDFFYSFFES